MTKGHKDWDGELRYCLALVNNKGDEHVGHEPATIATYIRLQASSAFHEKLFVLSAALGYAATCVNEDARNAHSPRWALAGRALHEAEQHEDWRRKGRT